MTWLRGEEGLTDDPELFGFGRVKVRRERAIDEFIQVRENSGWAGRIRLGRGEWARRGGGDLQGRGVTLAGRQRRRVARR